MTGATIVATSLGAMLAGRRSLVGHAQPSLPVDSPLMTRERPIWYAGSAALLQKTCVAIVGTREASDEGAARARRLARELAEQGFVVVSGLAKGVDTAALTSAIAAGGRVVAVIGTPIDQAYPAENGRLQQQIGRDHLLISQFAPGTRTLRYHFPARNKLMATVTDATAIVEAGNASGTLHQVAECVRLGRWLFIAKNVVDDPAWAWPQKFKDYPNLRTLAQTSDILDVLHP